MQVAKQEQTDTENKLMATCEERKRQGQDKDMELRDPNQCVWKQISNRVYCTAQELQAWFCINF